MTPTPMKPIILAPSRSKTIPMLETAIPARLDRLPWSPWHWRVVIALGVSWLLDGLEVTVVGSLGPALERPDTLGLTACEIGWAASAFLGGVLGFAILLVRRHVPESPRWLIRHGRAEEAERVVADIERQVGGDLPPVSPNLTMRALPAPGWGEIARLMVTRYRSRAALGLALMASQALFYNAIFFTYALVLAKFYGVPEQSVGYYIFPFALGNFLGPLLLGRLFDSIGRRRTIAATYTVAGLGLIAAGYGFSVQALSAFQLSLCWSAIFFVASAAASSAYLTVSEVFPVEMRAIAISLFYAAGTALGGFAGPPLYGAIIESGSRDALFAAYSFAGLLMCGAAAVALWLGVDAERKPLEEVCAPLGCDPLRT